MLKSRDPHLAGEQIWKMYEATKNNFGFWLRAHVHGESPAISLFLHFCSGRMRDIPSNKNRETLKNSGLKELMSTAH